MAKYPIFIDAQKDAIGNNAGGNFWGVREQDVNFKIADAVAAKLLTYSDLTIQENEFEGYKIELSRSNINETVSEDLNESLTKRTNDAKDFLQGTLSGVDLEMGVFIKIGTEAKGDDKIYDSDGDGVGVRCWYARNGVIGERDYSLAYYIEQGLVNDTNLAERETPLMKDYYSPAINVAGEDASNITSVSVNCGSINSLHDCMLLTENGQYCEIDKIAGSIAETINTWLTSGTEVIMNENPIYDAQERASMVLAEIENTEQQLIQAETRMVYNYIDDNMPEWAVNMVEYLVNKGYIKGDEAGLGLTDDMLRILAISARAGIFGVYCPTPESII